MLLGQAVAQQLQAAATLANASDHDLMGVGRISDLVNDAVAEAEENDEGYWWEQHQTMLDRLDTALTALCAVDATPSVRDAGVDLLLSVKTALAQVIADLHTAQQQSAANQRRQQQALAAYREKYPHWDRPAPLTN